MEHFQVTQSQNAEQMWYNTHNAHPDRLLWIYETANT